MHVLEIGKLNGNKMQAIHRTVIMNSFDFSLSFNIPQDVTQFTDGETGPLLTLNSLTGIKITAGRQVCGLNKGHGRLVNHV